METRKLQLLLHPLFIFSLACLLLNDLYWKYEYHNWITGKLSDFTGLFVLSIFLFAFFPKHRSTICTIVVILFIWWKTPYSQPIIDLVNQVSSVSVARTIDYSDYIALPVVFAPYFIKSAEYKLSFVKRIAAFVIAAICFISFCSTSIIRKFTITPDFSHRLSFNEEYKTRSTQEEIIRKLDNLGCDYKRDSSTIAPLTFYGGSLLIRRKDSLDKDWMVINPMQNDTVVYVRINEWRPFIAIYNFNANGEIFPQINIAVNNFENKKTIILQTIYLNDKQMDAYYKRPSKTKIQIRKLIQKELISKLQ